MFKRVTSLVLVALSMSGCFSAPLLAQESKVVHDAEYYILESQNKQKWSAEDKELDAKLAEMKKKYGRPPNIVYVLWDDMTFGAVGIPELQKNFGFTTPNINKFAKERNYIHKNVFRAFLYSD